MDNEVVIKDNVYRIKKMNAIEVLSMQSQISFENAKSTQKFYNQVLERLEVKCADKWLPVKEENKEIYFPAKVENDFESIQELIGFFMNWIKSVFQKSNE